MMSLKKIQMVTGHSWPYVLVLAAGLGLGMVAEHRLESRTPSPVRRPEPPPATEVALTPAPPAAWGEMETSEFTLELSDELLPQVFSLLRNPKWCFPRTSLQQMTNLFRSCRFTDTDLAQVLEGAELDITLPGLSDSRGQSVPLAEIIPDQVSVFPSSEFVLNLKADAREKIYSVLAASELNPGHRYPFRFPLEEFDGWFSNSGLPADKVALVKRMAYTNNQTACLADVEPLQRLLTPKELKLFLKAAYQAPTFTLRLRLSPQTDVSALARYWGRGGRDHVIKPFLEGLAKSPGTPTVSVAFLMPAFARTHLFTFPDPEKDPVDAQQQGLWTALNFFNDQPDPRFLEKTFARKTLATQFETTSIQPSYGDLVALVSPSGELQHVSVYIAGDVVFTRNGANSMQPWVLMKIPDMVAKFQCLGQARTVFYHRKSA
jgi:hypothetical protein